MGANLHDIVIGVNVSKFLPLTVTLYHILNISFLCTSHFKNDTSPC